MFVRPRANARRRTQASRWRPAWRFAAAVATIIISGATPVFGCDQILNVIHGEDVGFPGSCGAFTWDEALVYQNHADTNPTLVRGVDLAAGSTVIGGVTFTRNDICYDNTHDGFYLFAQAHRGDGTEGLYAGPTYAVYLDSCVGTPALASHDKPNDKKQPELCRRPGMAQYSAHSQLASLNIQDTPFSYTPPRGVPIEFTVTYNQRHTSQPDTFNFSNLGSKWTFNWLSYVIDDPNNQSAAAAVYVPGGGIEAYSGFNSSTQSYNPDPQSHAVLVRITSSSYEKRFPDGSKQVFTFSNGATLYPRRIFMTQVVDSAGNAVSIGYDSVHRIASLTDPLGQVTTILYEDRDSFKITKVKEPFPTARTATFSYTNGQLTTITDEIGIQSQLQYTGDFVNSLTTPYGTSTFATGQNGTNTWIEMTDPLTGKERVEFRDNAPSIPGSETIAPAASGITNSGLEVANSFYWDKKATQMYPPVGGVYDYTKARITHWAYNSDGSLSGIAASEKAPLENRIWYTYDGQSDSNHVGASGNPSQVARVLDNNNPATSTQLSQYTYNSIGKITKMIDPVGRVTTNRYDANNIDLLNVYQQRSGGQSTDAFGAAADLLASYGSYVLHKPQTVTDAAGQVTDYGYNPYGQVQTITNAKNETTTYGYGDGSSGKPVGYVVSITSPVFNSASAVTSFSYDSAHRIHTVTNAPDSYTVATDYDNLDRPTQVTYPDGTTRQFEYSQDFGHGIATILDLTRSKDRRGRWTTRHYTSNRQIDSITDPLGRTTTYNWCTCGALTSIQDARQKVTTFNRDLQSRVYQKVFGDTTTINYLYEGQSSANSVGTSSRLISATDALTQRTNYNYFLDDNVQQLSYTDGAGQPLNPVTPTVSFLYDPNYNRVVSMTDGTGTTGYTYYPVTAPAVLGAAQLKDVDGPLGNDTLTYTYDELGRITGRSINGVSATVGYDSLGRIGTEDNVLGHFSRIYDGTAHVTNRLQTLNYPTGQTANYAYFDNSNDRRLETITDLTSTSSSLDQSDYTYDAEGEIGTWTKQLNRSPQVASTFTNDLADQLTNVSNMTPGSPAINIPYSYDLGGNITSKDSVTYTYNNVNEFTGKGYNWDLNGNYGGKKGLPLYSWDAANRLTTIRYVPYLGSSTEFAYDGLNRRVQLLEKDANGVIKRTRKFVWDGMTIAEERDENNAVVKRFLPEGVQIVGAASPNSKLYYSRDHLGSIRSLTNESGTLLSTLDYDAWGGLSRAPVPANSTVNGPVITGAVSRQVHSTAGTFDITLPLSGKPGIECRNANGNYTLVLTFDRTVLSGTAQIASGIGSVVGVPVFAGSTATVQLSQVADRQTIIVELDNVVGLSGSTDKVLVAMSVLLGDVNQSGAVTVEDVNQISSLSGQAVTSTNFKNDVNLDGVINASDTDFTQTMQSQDSSLLPDFAFTGHYYHSRSGLYLAPYRAYDPGLGRWLSRDPLGYIEGANLYQYVRNDPGAFVDPLGLLTEDECAALRELLRREDLYGTYKAARMSGNTFGDRTIAPFNADGVGSRNIMTPRGELDVDWYVEMMGTGVPGFAPVNYLIGKTVWIIQKTANHQHVANYWFQDRGERTAILAALDGGFRDTFTADFMKRECGNNCEK